LKRPQRVPLSKKSENSAHLSTHLQLPVGGSPNRLYRPRHSPQQRLSPLTSESRGHLALLVLHQCRRQLPSASHGQHQSLRNSKNPSGNALFVHRTNRAPIVLFALSRIIILSGPEMRSSTKQTGQSTQVTGAEHTERSIHKAPSQPSLTASSRPSTPPPASPGGHGIGSSSTLFSYIKPMKTGDEHATGHPHAHSRPTTPKHVLAGGMASAQDADELGHRTGVDVNGQRQRGGVTGIPALSGRPLVHVRP